jgi:predicted dehydrogenase
VSSRRRFLIQAAGSLAGAALVPELAAMGPRALAASARVGLVGCGRQGRAIAEELSKIAGAELAAVCDTNAARLKATTDRLAGTEGFADHRALLERRGDVTAIIVATPTHLHRHIVEDALAAGRHVYCESPLANTLEDARAMAAAALGAKTVAMAGFQARSNPLYQRARPLVRTDAVRDLISLQGQWHRKTSWRFPPPAGMPDAQANWRLDPAVSLGLPGEVGAQQLDVFVWLRNRMPTRIEGRGAIRHHDDGRTVADTVQLAVAWDDRVVLDYEASLGTSYGGLYEVVHGSSGTIKLAWSHGWLFKEADAPTQGWEVYATRQQFHQDEGIILVADATKLAAQGQLAQGIGLPYSSLYYALGDFLKSATEGSPVACTMADGLKATALGILANQVVTQGTPIAVPTDL